MKTFILIFVTWIVLFLLFYISGCFSEASFNLSEWDSNIRNYIAIGYLSVSTITSAIIALDQSNKS